MTDQVEEFVSRERGDLSVQSAETDDDAYPFRRGAR